MSGLNDKKSCWNLRFCNISPISSKIRQYSMQKKPSAEGASIQTQVAEHYRDDQESAGGDASYDLDMTYLDLPEMDDDDSVQTSFDPTIGGSKEDDDEESAFRTNPKSLKSALSPNFEDSGTYSLETPEHNSSFDRIRQFGASTVDYIKEKASGFPYLHSNSERGIYGTPDGRFSPVLPSLEPSPLNEISEQLVIGFLSFSVVLLVAYIVVANPKIVYSVSGVVSNMVASIVSYATILLVSLVGALVIAHAVSFVDKRHSAIHVEFDRRTLELVERISNRVREAGDRGITEQHLQDVLMPLNRRSADDLKIWEAAIKLIEDGPLVNRSIDGIERRSVLTWNGATNRSKDGQARIVTTPNNSSGDLSAPTRCLKIRGLDQNCVDHSDEIKRDAYSCLIPMSPIHLEVCDDEWSSVCMMFSQLDDAKKAFGTFHDNPFQGTPVTVEFAEEEDYVKRFPEVASKTV